MFFFFQIYFFPIWSLIFCHNDVFSCRFLFRFISCDRRIGSRYPKTGQTVVVHYTGTLDNGTVFDSSRTRGKPFKFVIGRGEVIRGWDEGVAQVKQFISITIVSTFSNMNHFDCFIQFLGQMSVGERAKLICSPDYAYGSRGHPGIIPPNSRLTFDVELLNIE